MIHLPPNPKDAETVVQHQVQAERQQIHAQASAFIFETAQRIYAQSLTRISLDDHEECRRLAKKAADAAPLLFEELTGMKVKLRKQ